MEVDMKSLLLGALAGIILTLVILYFNLVGAMDKLHDLKAKFSSESFAGAEYGVVPKVPLFNKARDVDR